MQVAKWLGHSSYVLTLTTYADYIPEVEIENPMPEPFCGGGGHERCQPISVGPGRAAPSDVAELPRPAHCPAWNVIIRRSECGGL